MCIQILCAFKSHVPSEFLDLHLFGLTSIWTYIYRKSLHLFGLCQKKVENEPEVGLARCRAKWNVTLRRCKFTTRRGRLSRLKHAAVTVEGGVCQSPFATPFPYIGSTSLEWSRTRFRVL
ncbi:hypothetical protein NPIL_120661 [Nephila pilipes]|uniref:Uncharacterized protein n=1 Tax=Nephila pilipes TaxID=299642 RepID=A0A8X6T0Z5_NEPPI|nr:hypothetical protein NPIL_120661 [Nephila pilipes]